MDDDSLTEDEPVPSATIAIEYVDETLNFYVKSFSNVEPLPSSKKRRAKAIVSIATGVSRTTWMGRPKAPTPQELSSATIFRTLAVKREQSTVFNEFFSCPVAFEMFNRTLIRVHFCEVDKKDREVVVAECDLWLSQYANHQFREFVIPLTIARPDLGELEITMIYLPTAQRMCIDRVKATNLRIDPKSTEVYIRCWLFSRGFLDEVHKTEQKPREKDENAEYVFTKRLIFDLLRCDVVDAILLVEAVEKIGDEKRVIGNFGLSGSSTLCEQGLWRRTILQNREQVTAVMRLAPGV